MSGGADGSVPMRGLSWLGVVTTTSGFAPPAGGGGGVRGGYGGSGGTKREVCMLGGGFTKRLLAGGMHVISQCTNSIARIDSMGLLCLLLKGRGEMQHTQG